MSTSNFNELKKYYGTLEVSMFLISKRQRFKKKYAYDISIFDEFNIEVGPRKCTTTGIFLPITLYTILWFVVRKKNYI